MMSRKLVALHKAARSHDARTAAKRSHSHRPVKAGK